MVCGASVFLGMEQGQILLEFKKDNLISNFIVKTKIGNTKNIYSAVSVFDEVGDDCDYVFGCDAFRQRHFRWIQLLVKQSRQRIFSIHRIMTFQSKLEKR